MYKISISRWVALSVLFGCLGFGQSGGKLTGKISNTQGQGVANAELRLKNGADVVKSATTTSAGESSWQREESVGWIQ